MTTSSNASWVPSRPLVRGNAAHQILQDLRHDILGGRFPRGAKLPTERELAAGYGVSGATVREAVRGLIASGLVEVRHGSGAYVTGDPLGLLEAPLRSMIQMERIGVAEVLGVLKALNMHAAELAATRADAEETGRLREALVALETAGDADELSLRLTTFLNELAVISGNALLAVLSGFLAGIQVDLAMQLSGGTLAAWRKTVQRLARERERLVAAIEAHDAPAARQAASDYHDRAIKVITALPRGESAQVSDPLLASLIAATHGRASRKR
ncbi:MAG: bacterial regulatory s, gntR family protein [Ramlibacter sp.]|nr:bacterial regulatory s, gntR family protein [Ramlibacter sp.]